MSLSKLTNARRLAVRGLLNTERVILPPKRGPRQRYDLFTVWPRLLLQLAKLTKPNSVGTSAVLLSQLSLTICSKLTSLEIIKGLVRNLFDYGAPLKMFVYAKEVLARVPRIMEFAEKWRLMGADSPMLDPYDINDPESERLSAYLNFLSLFEKTIASLSCFHI